MMKKLTKKQLEEVCTITCYGQTSKMKRKEAIDSFMEGMLMSEGSERERYANIYAGLVHGRTDVSDSYNEF